MTETIDITYIPLLLGGMVHKRSLTISHQQLYGVITIAGIMLSSDRITIKLSSDIIVDISRWRDIININGEYTAMIGENIINFESMDFLSGCILLCTMFGMDPSNTITQIKHKGIDINVDYQRYIRKLDIPNFTNYSNGIVVDITWLNEAVDNNTVMALKTRLHTCFPEVKDIGVVIPTLIYTVSSDANQHNIVAIAMISETLSGTLKDYKELNAYNIYNICSAPEYRNQGLAKSAMISMINDLIQYGITSYILEVHPTNTAARSLYQSLGFIKIGTSIDREIPYDVMYLTFA